MRATPWKAEYSGGSRSAYVLGGMSASSCEGGLGGGCGLVSIDWLDFSLCRTMHESLPETAEEGKSKPTRTATPAASRKKATRKSGACSLAP